MVAKHLWTIILKITIMGTSPVVQWLRLPASNSGAMVSIPGQGTNSLRVTQQEQKSPNKHPDKTVCLKIFNWNLKKITVKKNQRIVEGIPCCQHFFLNWSIIVFYKYSKTVFLLLILQLLPLDIFIVLSVFKTPIITLKH